MTRINVAFAFDENMWFQTAVSIFSMCMADKNCRYNIYCLIDQNVHGIMKDLIRKTVRRTNNRHVRLHFIYFNGELLSHQFYNDGRARFPRAAMARIFLPKLLPNIKKIIWLDSDIIVCSHLRDLWRTKMTSKLIGGVRDINIGAVMQKYPNEFTHYEEYGLREMVNKFEYINSGVLLMNLREMRIFGWTEKCMAKIYSETRNIWYFDQDVINSVSRNRIEYLPLRYNRSSKLPLGLYISAYQQAGLSRATLMNDFYNYTVLHYAGNDKPWNNAGPYCEIWQTYAKMAGIL